MKIYNLKLLKKYSNSWKSTNRKISKIKFTSISNPTIKFIPEQSINTIKTIVIGKTLHGKTTLLNSFIIYYLLGIQYENTFRYKIIHEDFGSDRKQDKSQTSKVIAIELIAIIKILQS